MMSLVKRIELLISESGRSARSYAEYLGVAPQKIYDIMRGKTQKCPKDLAEAIVDKDKSINLSWLYTGIGDMHIEGDEIKTDPSCGIYIPAELVKMFGDMAATIKSQQEELRELRASTPAPAQKKSAGL